MAVFNAKQVFLGCSFQKRTSTYVHLAQDSAEEFGAHLVFGDNNPRAVQIRDTAFSLIKSSRVIILDLSKESVNVGVEYGYAQGLGKRHIYLLAQKPAFAAVQLPAMFKGLQYKTYSNLDGFNKRIIECMSRHYVRGRTFIDEADPEFVWLQDELLDLLGDLRKAPKSQLSDALNCHAPDATRALNVLYERGLVGREPNGSDPVYFLLESIGVSS